MNLAEVIDGAQEESGVSYKHFATRRQCVEHIQQVRKALLTRVVEAWRNSENGGVVEIDVPAPTQGFGFNFGFNFGLGIGIATSAAIGTRMELVLMAEARRIVGGAWVLVNIGRVSDAEALRLPNVPLLALHDTAVEFVEPELWAPFDKVRLTGVVSYGDVAEATAVEPNTQLGPLFARVLVCDLAAWLAVKAGEIVLAAQKRAEARLTTGLLMAQCRSQSTIEVVR